MASQDDMLTAQKNGVLATNSVVSVIRRAQGQYTSQTVTSATVIALGEGFLVSFAVVVAGAAGLISNFNTTSPAAANAMAATPATVGIYPAGMVFTSGLVVVPGAGQSVNVTYSLGGIDVVNQRA
tara:strand:+ start:1024 stop:1398 length:375 start_codon:yes stop_codon:yes gene_type:complete